MPVRFFISKELTESQSLKLKEAGVEFLALPLIETLPVDFDSRVVSDFSPNYAIFSSKNGVRFFFNRLDPSSLRGTEVIAVGSATAKELEALGFSPIVPENFSGEGLVGLLKNFDLREKRFLVVRPRKARSLVIDFLRERGANLLELIVYETVPREGVGREVFDFFLKGVDYAAFTSPSNFKTFLKVVPKGRELLKGVKLIPIGHVTERAIEREGLTPLSPPKEYTVDGLIERLFELESLP